MEVRDSDLGQCEADAPKAKECPSDSVPNGNGGCACAPGTVGDPGHCADSANDSGGSIGESSNSRVKILKKNLPPVATCPENTQGTPPDCPCSQHSGADFIRRSATCFNFVEQSNAGKRRMP